MDADSGTTTVAPDGRRAVLSTKEYDFQAKKFDETLWMVDLDKAAALGDDALRKHEHLTPLVSGSASAPCWSPCGEWIAFLSDREDGNDDKNKAKTAVWLLPAPSIYLFDPLYLFIYEARTWLRRPPCTH